MKTPDLVHRFLTSIGRPAEAETYLKLYRSERPESFAVVHIASEIAGHGLAAVAADIQLLASLGLTPILCAPPLLCDALLERLGDVDLRRATRESAASAARDGAIPVIAHDGDVAELAPLTEILEAHKVVCLRPRSGLQPRGGPVVSLLDLRREADALAPLLPDEQAALLSSIRQLIDAVPHRLTVAVTSPLDLVRELFTVRGAGTLVRLGADVHRLSTYDDVHRPRLDELFASSFGQRPAPALYDRPTEAIYVAGDYRGVAIIEARPLCPYLSKFAVDVAAQGEGVGGDLWRCLVADYPRLLWRCRPQNPIIGWYEQRCDGLVRAAAWQVFWRGLAPDEISWAVELALDAPIDFS